MDSETNNSNQTNSAVVSTRSLRKYIGGILLVVIILGIVFRLGYNFGQSGYSFSLREFKVVNKTSPTAEVDYGLLWEALNVVGNKYIEKDNIDQRKVLYGAIQGAVQAAGDEYTEFFDPETLAQFKTELEGKFSGIGAEIGKREGNIVVVAPLDDSPAQRAGLKANDIIVRVDDASVSGKNVDQVVDIIRGESGTQVKLTLFREGGNGTFDVTITRAQIELKSVKVSYKQVGSKQVAILKISRFGDDTERLFEAAVSDIRSKNVAGIVVDVRNNPGGYLDTSVDVASDWLERGKLIVKEAHSEKDVKDYTSSGLNRLGNIKTVVLINGGSASASEILSGALKDNGKAILIGEKSFGKGSVQELVPLSQNTAVKVTVAKWITPGGKNLHKDGLVPDIEVKMTEEDYEKNLDPQLDRAVAEAAK
ncbi:S41 family peptidase [bacterium]|nr:MAG: S41 family peptidase [bacterium]